MENRKEKKTVIYIAASCQEQSTGVFVNTLNEIRLKELLKKYTSIDLRKADADQELASLREQIAQLKQSNRGGTTGMHGFIGERVQVSFSNERAAMQGAPKAYFLIDDNGMTDYTRGSDLIQQKACISDKSLGLTFVAAHADNYPVFLEKHGIYQIPKDFYALYRRFVNMPEEVALKLRKEDLRMWKRVQDFKASVPNAKIEPMVATYGEIQAGAIDGTIDREEARLNMEYSKQREAAKYSCRATLKEGIRVTASSAAIEGLVDGGFSVFEHMQDGTKIRDFEQDDWKEIGKDALKGCAKGAVRGAFVYTVTNTTQIPASAASAAVTGAFSIAEATTHYVKGECTTKEYVAGIADGCIGAAVSAASTELGKRLIPIPFLGPIIGNAVGTFLYKSAKRIWIKYFADDFSGKYEAAYLV